MDGCQPTLMMHWWRKDEAVEEEGRTPERRGIVGVCSGFADRAQNRGNPAARGAVPISGECDTPPRGASLDLGVEGRRSAAPRPLTLKSQSSL